MRLGSFGDNCQTKKRVHPFSPLFSCRVYWLCALIFFAAALCYGQYGFRGKLNRDQANHLYAAQRMAEGVPPYVSIFNHKTPLSTMMAGGAATAAKTFAWDDIYAVRVVFFLI